MTRSGSAPTLRRESPAGGIGRLPAVGPIGEVASLGAARRPPRSSSGGAIRRSLDGGSVVGRWEAGACVERLRHESLQMTGATASERAAANLARSPMPRQINAELFPAQLVAGQAAAPGCDIESDAGRSVCSGQSMLTASTLEPPAPPNGEDADLCLHHEGWLAKRTSAKIARWQRRYFSLNGAILCYCHEPGMPSKRSFDVRRARRISVAMGQARELELDFGFRVWRLRADSAEVARRWLVMLEAAQLVAGGPEVDAGGEDWSDDDVKSVTSSATSGSGALSPMPHARALTPQSARRGQAGAGLEVVPVALDKLEVDQDKLDRRFETWLPLSRVDGRIDSKAVRSGLDCALQGLWLALRAHTDEEPPPSPQRTQASAVQASLSVLGPMLQAEHRATSNAIDCVVAEFTTRMLQRLARWLQEGDPQAEEIIDVVTWLLFEAKPALALLEKAASHAEAALPALWRSTVDAMEYLLLSEWEPRSCDEVSKQAQAIYVIPLSARKQTEQPPGSTRTHLTLGILRSALRHWEAWQTVDTARERATSVMIATLSAVLRTFRTTTRPLLGDQYIVVSLKKPKHAAVDAAVDRIGKALRGLAKRTRSRSQSRDFPEQPSIVASTWELLEVAAEASMICDFCAEAQVRFDRHASATAVQTDVFAAFARAFGREAATFSTAIVEASFPVVCVGPLKNLKFGQAAAKMMETREDEQQYQGLLSEACRAAAEFLEEIFTGSPSSCSSAACNAVVRQLIDRWVRQFRKAPPKLSGNPQLPRLIEADELALKALARHWEADATWKGAMSNPVQPLHEVRRMLEESSSPEAVAMRAARLELSLGEEQGRGLANAVRLAALR